MMGEYNGAHYGAHYCQYNNIDSSAPQCCCVMLCHVNIYHNNFLFGGVLKVIVLCTVVCLHCGLTCVDSMDRVRVLRHLDDPRSAGECAHQPLRQSAGRHDRLCHLFLLPRRHVIRDEHRRDVRHIHRHLRHWLLSRLHAHHVHRRRLFPRVHDTGDRDYDVRKQHWDARTDTAGAGT